MPKAWTSRWCEHHELSLPKVHWTKFDEEKKKEKERLLLNEIYYFNHVVHPSEDASHLCILVFLCLSSSSLNLGVSTFGKKRVHWLKGKTNKLRKWEWIFKLLKWPVNVCVSRINHCKWIYFILLLLFYGPKVKSEDLFEQVTCDLLLPRIRREKEESKWL